MSSSEDDAVIHTPINHPNASTSALQDLQKKQRRILDIVGQVRDCGLEGELSLPQLVVCGDQSSGKSSVLEALAGIPFPTKDGLCTRFATVINLRRSPESTIGTYFLDLLLAIIHGTPFRF